MARRGDELREHMLWVAKGAFLELGFERASMDEVARRARTSKRSLYAHFENKQQLFLAVIDLVRGLFFDRLKWPADYAAKPAEALTQFCARYVEAMLYEPSVQLARITIAELARFPAAAAQHHDVVFTEVERRIADYLKATIGLAARPSADAAQRLIAQLLHPRFPRALFGLEELVERLDDDALSPTIDVRAIRRAVAELFESFSAT
jgi:AcrR family transcriptional regulator